MTTETLILTRSGVLQEKASSGGAPDLMEALAGIVPRCLFELSLGSGAARPRDIPLVAPTSGSVVHEPLSAISEPPSAASDLVRTILDGLSMTTVQASRAVGVSRQAIYDYSKGTDPRPDRLARLQTLARLAQYWKGKQAGSLAGKTPLPFDDGQSLLDLLSAQTLDDDAVRTRLDRIAAFLLGVGLSPFSPRPSIREELGTTDIPEASERRKTLNREAHRTRSWLKRRR